MKRVLYDTNVVLDVLLQRLPHLDLSSLHNLIDGSDAQGSDLNLTGLKDLSGLVTLTTT